MDSLALCIVSVMVEEKGKQPWTRREFGGKTLWDWLQLLIVPAVLTLITVGFALWQDTRQDQVENARINQAQKIEDQRAEAERELAVQRAQDEALQAYLDQMSHLLLEKDLRGSKEGSAVRTLARARTFAVMPRLDAERNQTIARFLGESKLIAPDDAATISLLRGAPLRHADIEDAALSGADLSGAKLQGADLSGANLSDADLSGADLEDAVGLTDDQLRAARSLKHATMPDGQTLGGDKTPDGPTLEDWLKDKEGRKEAGENE